MKLPREPFSWDGSEDEEPVPVTEDGLAVLAAAESHVRSAQDALARQDTDPAVIDLRESDPLTAEPPGRLPVGGRALRLTLVALVCSLAFAHGWQQGAAQASPPRCESAHCGPDLAP